MINDHNFANNHIRRFKAISSMSWNKTMIKIQLMRIVQGAELKVYDISYPSNKRAHHLGVTALYVICLETYSGQSKMSIEEMTQVENTMRARPIPMYDGKR